ncbi:MULTISPECIES: hypothetical protein [Sandaracinus]|uniref:hypothetical protein n=1 Tax=Sandaracinus TaxID=1055688 RepID=UPI0019D46448|nr:MULTISPECIES: hypothetical protein [Sandaracinus]UJR87225.1 Hypothetical protein I5071_160 [Sandaracinus amylolyticus]
MLYSSVRTGAAVGIVAVLASCGTPSEPRVQTVGATPEIAAAEIAGALCAWIVSCGIVGVECGESGDCVGTIRPATDDDAESCSAGQETIWTDVVRRETVDACVNEHLMAECFTQDEVDRLALAYEVGDVGARIRASPPACTDIER